MGLLIFVVAIIGIGVWTISFRRKHPRRGLGQQMVDMLNMSDEEFQQLKDKVNGEDNTK